MQFSLNPSSHDFSSVKFQLNVLARTFEASVFENRKSSSEMATFTRECGWSRTSSPRLYEVAIWIHRAES